MTARASVGFVCKVLRESGLSSRATWTLFLPLGRRARVETMLRNRLAVLEAKNTVLDRLFRIQKALEPLGLETAAQVQSALRDPGPCRLLIALGLGRTSLADELTLSGVASGAALDQALRELLAEQRVLRVTPPAEVAGEDLYIVVHKRGRGRYDTAAIGRLLQPGARYGDQLRARERRESTTNEGRTYNL